MGLVRAPWWCRVLHRPGSTLISTAALRMGALLPFALQIRARTFFQEELLVVLPEESACQLVREGTIEEDVTSFLLTYVAEGMTCIDGGANLGYFTLLATTLVGPSGLVHAFEPARRTCGILRHNSAQNFSDSSGKPRSHGTGRFSMDSTGGTTCVAPPSLSAPMWIGSMKR
jgi:hypothetical protein